MQLSGTKRRQANRSRDADVDGEMDMNQLLESADGMGRSGTAASSSASGSTRLTRHAKRPSRVIRSGGFSNNGDSTDKSAGYAFSGMDEMQ